ncbi:long-chain acyl-CoA synthetase [Pseudomonas fluorescens]|uniref:AMP-binding protein n=1 Tax=Pseudomonas lactucae TaxID=2813360 RepID=A0A9X0Y9F6_9PSED|nr:AMP-binding protein [Pseudomonas lactucae]OPA90122.1 long-chain acyl-CoA synthetase [Pseudomonas fluorescens]MBN2975687.1 AMP-binding protein [Pseudomonas lactucae]MBN2988989.1 AMP-binding protein [Pseudomonas lactucae]OPB09391.1 long-chain acyl-CoA synthetase [Pseudomonas fluorescens]OPB21236.1 long-chain acyl-CoA synthetase [Pseudomonas fluorescens]
MSPETRRFHAVLRAHAERNDGAVALWGDTLKMDYATLFADVSDRQRRLRDERVKVVALALDNGVDAMLWDLAVLFEGLTCVTLPPFFSPAQRAHCLAQSHAERVIAEPYLDAELHALGYRKAGEFWCRTFTGRPPMPFGTAKLTFTSGTTGTPKGVCLSADSLLRVARQLHQASHVTDPRHHLALLPMAILLENLGCYAALYAGATLSVPGQRSLGIQGASAVEAAQLFGCLAMRQPHSLILVPQLLLMLVVAAEQKAFDPQSLRFAAVGGARVSTALLQRAQQLGIPVFEGYGLSECASVVCLNQVDAHRSGSVGKPLPHVQIRLAEDGEVLIKGSTLLGYLGQAEPPEPWWPSGDLGAFDADGFLYLKGRKKHQFVTSYGRNVNPDWVEAELTQGGVIAQAFVSGEAQPSNHALLWPHRAECTDAQLAAAIATANSALPDYAQVHHWTRLDEPFSAANGLLTANGRPRREAIVARYQTLLVPALNEETPS